MHFSALNKEEPLPSGHGHEGGILPFSEIGLAHEQEENKRKIGRRRQKAVPTHA